MNTLTAVVTEIKKAIGKDIPIEPNTMLLSIGMDSLHKVQVMVELESFYNTNLEALFLEKPFLDSYLVSDMVKVMEHAISQKPLSFKIDNHHKLTGSDLISLERNRQINEEGYNKDHDKFCVNHELVMAAICYAMPAELRPGNDLDSLKVMGWPWGIEDWKPGRYSSPETHSYKQERIRELVKAGALIAAEIDRLKIR